MTESIMPLAILGCVLIFGPAAAQETQTQPRAGGAWAEITIENTTGGAITASFGGGNGGKGHLTPMKRGKVLKPIDAEFTAVTVPGFTAANMFGKDSCVVATAANAVHLRIKKNSSGMALLFSLMPKEFYTVNIASYTSYSGASVITDMPGGTGIFGKDFAPYLGSEVTVKRDGKWSRLDKIKDYSPRLGDTWKITVEPPAKAITSLHFRNSINGDVTAYFADKSSETVARVIRPVRGVGGFTGAVFVANGQIRAHHPGVLDISTSRRWESVDENLKPRDGGAGSAFQVVPFEHTEDYASPADGYAGEGFFGYARTLPVYMLLETPGTRLEKFESFGVPVSTQALALRRAFIKALRTGKKLSEDELAGFSAIPGAARVFESYSGIEDYFETMDRDGSVVFARLNRPRPAEATLYANGMLFGIGWVKPGQGHTKVRMSDSREFTTPPEFNHGKDLSALADWEEIVFSVK